MSETENRSKRPLLLRVRYATSLLIVAAERDGIFYDPVHIGLPSGSGRQASVAEFHIQDPERQGDLKFDIWLSDHSVRQLCVPEEIRDQLARDYKRADLRTTEPAIRGTPSRPTH